MDKLNFWFAKNMVDYQPLIAYQFDYLSTRIPDWENLSLDVKLSIADKYKNEVIELLKIRQIYISNF